MKASDLFVRALEAEGVEYIFGIPGEENLDLLDSLCQSSIKLILTRHEQAAGMSATTGWKSRPLSWSANRSRTRAIRMWPAPARAAMPVSFISTTLPPAWTRSTTPIRG